MLDQNRLDSRINLLDTGLPTQTVARAIACVVKDYLVMAVGVITIRCTRSLLALGFLRSFVG